MTVMTAKTPGLWPRSYDSHDQQVVGRTACFTIGTDVGNAVIGPGEHPYHEEQFQKLDKKTNSVSDP